MRWVALGVVFTAVCSGQGRVLTMEATAFSQDKKPTAALTEAREGIVAADPNVLPLGTWIRISGAGPYDGVYLVADTGRTIGSNEIDIYLGSPSEAKRFGRQRVRVQVLEKGKGKQDARKKDQAASK